MVLPNDALLKGMAAALHYQNADDPQAVELQGWIEQDGVEAALLRATGLKADEPCVVLIVAEYQRMMAIVM